MPHSQNTAVPEQAPMTESSRRRRMPNPVLRVLQLLLVVMVATTSLVTAGGAASASNEPNGGRPQTSPPPVVYRGDSRSPNDIFANGFVSRGTNYDLTAHVQGDREHNSGYISTSGSVEMAESFARSQGLRNLAAEAAQPRCQGVGWSIGQSIPVVGWLITSSCHHTVVTARTFVYTIRPEFASVMLHVPNQVQNTALARYGSQDEWAFMRRIPNWAITGVRIYAMEGRAVGDLVQPQSITFRYETWVPNPNYNIDYFRNHRYNPSTDPAAEFSPNTRLNLPPVCNRACH